MPVKVVIFSRDRAMQLDGLLQSLFLHCKDMELAQITVLYKASNERHIAQYQKLDMEYARRVVFKKQEDFRRDTLLILNLFAKNQDPKKNPFLFALGGVGFPLGSLGDRVWRRTFGRLQGWLAKRLAPAIPKQSFVFFLVDDSMFVRDFLLQDIIETLNRHDDMLGFSLRLGENTTYCYSLRRPQTLPEFTRFHNNIYRYAWIKSEHDFGYPLEVSSSVYRLKDILPLLFGIYFENPNTLEERMAFQADSFKSRYPYLGCCRYSVTFCNPINMVQSITPNRAGEQIQYDVNELADRFERGERIQVKAYDGFVPNACHQEVKLAFEKRESNDGNSG